MFRGGGGGSGLMHKYFIEIPVSPTILCGGTDKTAFLLKSKKSVVRS